MPSFRLPPLQVMLALATSTSALPTFSSLAQRATAQAATNLCDMPDDSLILSGTPWIVYNMMYDSDQIVGSACTGYEGTTTGSDGNLQVKWNSTWEIEYVESTDNIPKGYSFVGLTENLENTISDIASIPATFDWTRTNTTAYKGNVCFDFMTSDTKGDSTSSAAQELMLWLQYEGGQLPIGWTDGAVATIDSLYGTSWKLYQGVNTDSGITVSSLLPDTQFTGSFSGDIKDWLDAMVTQGLFTDSTYVNVGNAGTEPFYGDAVLEATLGLQINLGSDTTSSVASAPNTAPASSPASSSSVAPVSSSTTTVAAETPFTSTVAFVLPSSSSSTIIVEETTTPVASFSAAPTSAVAAIPSTSSAAEGVTTAPAATTALASYTTEAPTMLLTSAISATPTVPPSAADPVFLTGNSARPSGFRAGQHPRPTPDSGADTSTSGIAAAKGEEDEEEGSCAVQYVYA